MLQGGAEYQALLLAEELKQNMPVSFLFRNHWKLPDRLRHAGYTLWGVTPFSPRGFANSFIFESREVYRILKRISPTIIYIRGANTYACVAALYAKKYPCRIIWHNAHDRDAMPLNYETFKRYPFSLIDKKMINYGILNSDVVLSQTWRQAFLLKKHFRKKSNLVIGNWHPVPPPSKKQRSPVLVLWIANWRPFKQPHVFIKLAKSLNNLPNVKFIMVGRIRQENNIESMAKNAGITIYREMPIADVNKLLSKSHLLVNTSTMEGFSNTFIQAWLNQVPVVSLNADPDQILKRRGLGYCSGTFENLVSDTKKLVLNHDLREETGIRARAHAIRYHSLKNILQIRSFFQ